MGEERAARDRSIITVYGKHSRPARFSLAQKTQPAVLTSRFMLNLGHFNEATSSTTVSSVRFQADTGTGISGAQSSFLGNIGEDIGYNDHIEEADDGDVEALEMPATGHDGMSGESSRSDRA